MFSVEADLFFLHPRTSPSPPDWFSVLYLLRRDINICMGVDSATGRSRAEPAPALWPGTMAILAGIDLLGKFFAGEDTSAVGERFRSFVERFFDGTTASDRDAIYHLRNALLHSFGLYSRDVKSSNIYRFILSDSGTAALVSHNPPDEYCIDLRVLHRKFERAVSAYCNAIGSDTHLQSNFTSMYPNYGRVHIQ